MEPVRPHNIVPVTSIADAHRRGLEYIPRSKLGTVQEMTVDQRAAWLKDRKAKRKAARKARKANRSK